MELKEVINKRIEIEALICGVLDKFTEETGLYINNMSFDSISFNGEPRKYLINIDVKI